MVFHCVACGRQQEHDTAKGCIPVNWSIIRIHSRAQLFCFNCSHHFRKYSGVEHPAVISPFMQSMLKRRGLLNAHS